MMKVAQFLATVPDALPEEYARELATLQSNAPAMGPAFVRRRMQTELGPQWQSRFAQLRAGGRRRREPWPGASRDAA
jgi:predicted unusual protein kinase regulating ubiquinone biosynthesis (AarF/ABC1/UbiB family)